MKFKTKSLIIFILLGISLSCFAAQAQTVTTKNQCAVTSSILLNQRITAIKQYMKLLGQGDYKRLPTFFLKNALVTDPIKGTETPKEYYNGLYAYLINPHLTLYDIYPGIDNPNMIAAHFNMKIKLKDQVINRGEFMDLFVFSKNSAKITKLLILSNTK